MGRPAASHAELKAAHKLLLARGIPPTRYQLQKVTGAAVATLDRLLPFLDLPTDDGEKISGLNEKLAALLKPVTEGLFELADEQFAFEKTDFEKQIAQLEAQLQQQNETIKRVVNEKQTLEKAVAGLQTDLEATAASLSQAEHDKLTLENQLNTADKINLERTEQIGALRQQVEKSRLDLAHFREASAKQRDREQQEIAREKQALVDDKRQLKQEISLQESQIQKLKTEISTHMQTVSRFSTDLTNAKKRVDQVEREKGSATQKWEESREKNAELKSELTLLRHTEKTARADATKLKTAMEGQDKEVKRLTGALEQAQAKQIKLAAQVDTQATILKQLTKKP